MERTVINVLHIEDSLPAAARTKHLLESLNDDESFAVHVIGDLASLPAAVAAYHEQSRPIDVILLDLILPNGAGINVVRKVVAACPEASIVILTGYNDPETIEEAMRLPEVWDYLVKDRFDLNALVASLRYAVKRHKLELRFTVARGLLEAAKATATLSAKPAVPLPGNG